MPVWNGDGVPGKNMKVDPGEPETSVDESILIIRKGNRIIVGDYEFVIDCEPEKEK